MKLRIILGAVALLSILFFLRPEEETVPSEHAHFAMGTLVTFKLYTEEEKVDSLVRLAFDRIDRIDSLMSRYSRTSELNLIENLSADEEATCSPELAQVLQRSQHFARSSAGAFDVTVGVLTRLWDFPNLRAPPPAEQIDSALTLVGFEYLQVRGRQVRLVLDGVRLDLGAAAKGYAVDQAVESLLAAGISCGMVEAGGDIRYWGRKPDGRPWRFGVQHPRDPEQFIAVEDLGLNAVATSGDYEQFIEFEGRRFHHILDPATGYPSRRAISATAWASTALDADILSTALFILGPDQGIKWIESLPRAEALIFFDREGNTEYRTSSGVQNRIRFVKE